MSELTSGPKVVVHETTGTYLYPDGWSDAINMGVQNWNEDPLHAGMLHLWYFFANGDGSYRIETKNQRCLTSGVTATAWSRFKTAIPRSGPGSSGWSGLCSEGTRSEGRPISQSSRRPTPAMQWA